MCLCNAKEQTIRAPLYLPYYIQRQRPQGKKGGGTKHTVGTVLELVKRLGSVFHKKKDDDHLLDYLLFHRSFIASPSLRQIN